MSCSDANTLKVRIHITIPYLTNPVEIDCKQMVLYANLRSVLHNDAGTIST